MSKLSLNQIDDLAHLARLSLNEAQKQQFAAQLSDVLQYVEQINRLKTERIAVTSTITGLTNVLRDDNDSATACLPVKEALKNAPDTKDGHFKVKAIFEDD